MVYPHKWSPISYRSSAGQRKHAGQRPTFTAGPRNQHGMLSNCHWTVSKRCVVKMFSFDSFISSPACSVRQIATSDTFTSDIRCVAVRRWPTIPQIHYTVSQKNVPPLACYNVDTHEWILIFFGRIVTDKVGYQKALYYATSSNLCFCTTWQNWETRKSHFHSVGLCYAQNAPVRSLPERKSCHNVMCLIASNIC